MAITNLTLEAGDHVLPCPFCCSFDIELKNTHTASYWVECNACGAQVSGEAFAANTSSDKIPVSAHRKAKESALRKWNTRANYAEAVFIYARLAGEHHAGVREAKLTGGE